jgi:hypothetical protein
LLLTSHGYCWFHWQVTVTKLKKSQ